MFPNIEPNRLQNGNQDPFGIVGYQSITTIEQARAFLRQHAKQALAHYRERQVPRGFQCPVAFANFVARRVVI